MDDAKQLTIFGAGLAGLIAARMLIERKPVILEQKDKLPNNHHALLRFRSDAVGEATNIPFRKVSVSKNVIQDAGSNQIRNAVIYSRKVSGMIHSRSVMDLSTVDRYIAPKDLVARLASTADIQYGKDFLGWSSNLIKPHGPVISTIPVPVMMEMFKWKDAVKFSNRAGWTIKASINPDLDCKLNATIYSARSSDIWYRASVTDDHLMIEGAGSESIDADQCLDILNSVVGHFGLMYGDLTTFACHGNAYQKISDLSVSDRESVKRFVMWLSNRHQIYSLGRFATWRPKLLLDDLVNDVRVIARLIDGESSYQETIRG
jgi:hypothetical protein